MRLILLAVLIAAVAVGGYFLLGRARHGASAVGHESASPGRPTEATAEVGAINFRVGVAGACASCLTAGAVSMLAMVNGYGPLTGSDPVENALSLVAFHVVMSIIFAGAPLVNAIASFIKHPPQGGLGAIRWPFWLGILLAAVGGALVTKFKPDTAAGPGPKPPVTQSASR